jgi:RHS repeat-associated protein
MNHSSNCTQQDPVGGCANTLLRSVWDGDQLLSEMQSRADSGSSQLELDGAGSGASYGIVRYLHADGLDAPLAIYKGGTLAVLPFQNYRGTVDLVVCPRMVSCGDVPVPGLTDGLNARDGGRSTGPLGFYGTIQGGMKTGSGLVYQRNRFVDPVTGTFTQADPLGLGGGLSAWGFAGGDPVNYADPFGLAPCPPDNDCAALDMLYGATGAVVGMYVGGPPAAPAGALSGAASQLLSSSAGLWRTVAFGVLTTAVAGLDLLHSEANGPGRRGFQNFRTLNGRQIGKNSVSVDGEIGGSGSPQVHVEINGPGYDPKGNGKIMINNANDLSGLPKSIRNDAQVIRAINKAFERLTSYLK